MFVSREGILCLQHRCRIQIRLQETEKELRQRLQSMDEATRLENRKRFAKHDLWQRKRTSNEKISLFDLFVCLFVGWLVACLLGWFCFFVSVIFVAGNSITPWFGSSTVRQLQGSLSTNVTRILTTGVSWMMFLMEKTFSSPRGRTGESRLLPDEWTSWSSIP